MKLSFSKRLFVLFIIAVYFLNSAKAQTIPTPLDGYIMNEIKDHTLPGLAFSIIKDGKVALSRGYGVANIDKDIPYTPNTIMGVAGFSKTVTATAVMKLWERGYFQLDDPINNYLPFQVKNPFFPNTHITFRMLLTHTASIGFGLVSVNGTLKQIINSPGAAQPLGSFLQNYFTPGGNLYVSTVNYLNFQPGTHYEYSNSGYALLGYLVEKISGMPFNQYCNQNIFQPLCMRNTAWYYSELDTNLVARPYRYNNNLSQATDINLYEYPDYPANGLKSTTLDLSKFMLMHTNNGTLGGIRILDSSTEMQMRTFQVAAPGDITVSYDGHPFFYNKGECLGFWKIVQYSYENEIQYGHTGIGPGVIVRCYFIPEDDENTIVTVFSNADNKDEQVFAHLDIFLDLDTEVADTVSDENKPPLNCIYYLNPCVHNETFWKNHQQEWPFNSIPMKIGNKHYYTKNQILDLLNRPVNGDASIALGKTLVAAKLNIARGSELSPIILTVNAAMNSIGDKRLPYDNPVPFSSPLGVQMLALTATLNSYNAGNMNTTSCSGIQSITHSNVVNEIEPGDKVYSLSVFPNPSSVNATISFLLPQTENVFLSVFDASGRCIKQLANIEFTTGNHQITWNTTDVSSGIYFLKMETPRYSKIQKLVITK